MLRPMAGFLQDSDSSWHKLAQVCPSLLQTGWVPIRQHHQLLRPIPVNNRLSSAPHSRLWQPSYLFCFRNIIKLIVRFLFWACSSNNLLGFPDKQVVFGYRQAANSQVRFQSRRRQSQNRILQKSQINSNICRSKIFLIISHFANKNNFTFSSVYFVLNFFSICVKFHLDSIRNKKLQACNQIWVSPP